MCLKIIVLGLTINFCFILIAQNNTGIKFGDSIATAQYYNSLFALTSTDSIDKRYEYAQKACAAALKTNNHDEYIQALIHLGNIYNHQYRYDLAMEALLKAKKVADSLGKTQMQANIFHQIGSLYLDMRNLPQANEHLSKALVLKRKNNDDKSIALTINSLALTYWLQGRLDTALAYLFETLKIEERIKNEDGISRAYNNIGIVYHEKKEFANSLNYLFKALEINQKQFDTWSIAETCNNIGETYISMGKYADAEQYLKKAYEHASKLNALILLSDNYRYRSRLNKRLKKFDKALEYYELFNQLEDSLFNRNKYTIISELKSSFEIEKREDEIKFQNQKIEVLEAKKKVDTLEKLFLGGIILLILIAGTIIINRQKKINDRNRMLIEKDKQIQFTQNLLMQKEIADKQRLSVELEQSNKFLIDFALYIGMKNEFLLKIKEELKKIARKDSQSSDIKLIINQLNQNLRYNKELIDLQKNVEKVNIEFIQKLMAQFPDLTENDRNLAVLLRLNFSSKEIADLRAVSIKAVEMSRYRLRKRFNLEKQDSLTHFLQNI